MTVLEFNLVQPTFNPKSKELKISKSRNLLVEFQNSHFTSSDYNLSPYSTTIICGPNGSGKSIYLKNLGNVIYLA